MIIHYKGFNITRATRPGVMKYGTYSGTRFYYADTLAGMKETIRDIIRNGEAS